MPMHQRHWEVVFLQSKARLRIVAAKVEHHKKATQVCHHQRKTRTGMQTNGSPHSNFLWEILPMFLFPSLPCVCLRESLCVSNLREGTRLCVSFIRLSLIGPLRATRIRKSAVVLNCTIRIFFCVFPVFLLSISFWTYFGNCVLQIISPSVWKPANAFRLSKHVREAPAANSLPPNCEAHFVTWSGKRRERSTPNREQCCLSSCVQQKNRGNLFEFQSTSSLRTEGWTLHPLLLLLLLIIITPSLPSPPHHQQGKKKLAHWELNCACTFLFGAFRRYGKVVSLPTSLFLSLSQSLPPSPSFRLSCARICTEQL